MCFSVTAYCSILWPVVHLWARGDFRLCCYLHSLHTRVTAGTPFGRQGFSDVGGLSCTEVSLCVMLSRLCSDWIVACVCVRGVFYSRRVWVHVPIERVGFVSYKD